jgi:hypothetical protein
MNVSSSKTQNSTNHNNQDGSTVSMEEMSAEEFHYEELTPQ